MDKHKLFKVNQHIILENSEGRILLLKQDGRWMLPGGHLEVGETATEGLKRELSEEVGIQNFEISGIVDARTSASGNTYAVTFTGRARDESLIITSAEHEEAKWFSKDEIGALEFITPEEKEIIKNTSN